MRKWLVGCCLFFGFVAGALGAAAPFALSDYLDLEGASEVRLSPNGRDIAYTRTTINRMEDRTDSEIWLVDLDGAHHRLLAKGAGPVWSPDGKSLAFIAPGEPKGTQIYVWRADVGGAPSPVTHLTEAPANLRWSPDGRWIGYTAFVPSVEKWSVDLPAAPEGAKWTKTPRYTERLHYRRDRTGFTERGNRHLFLVSAAGGAVRQLTTGDWSVGSAAFEVADTVVWDFMPDGRSVVIEGYNEGDRDFNDRDSYLYSVSLVDGAIRRLTSTPGSWQRPAVSPDGKTIAYVGVVHNDDSSRVADLYTMAADGSAATLRSAGFDREPQNLTWSSDGATLYFTAEDRGSVHLYAWTPKGGVRSVTEGPEVVRDYSAVAGKLVAIRSTFDQPADVVQLVSREHGAPVSITHLNCTLLGRLALATSEELEVASGGTKIQGWLVKPHDFDPKRHYPLLLEIHGGPHAMYNVAFNPSFQSFAANGYLVLYINPHGSTGYGSAFANSIMKHYPGIDYDDLMASVDAVVAKGYVDTKRMYVAGCSGGGVLSSWVIAHTDRFAAAAVRCPVTDWISMAGETDIPYFTHRWFQKPFWEDPSDWLALSPVMQVGHVKTPTLLMTGDLDMRTPMPQTEEFYAALKMRGVPSALLRFDGEYHGTASKPSNWMRTQAYMMSWFDRFGGHPAAEK
jgi:dipeptidyl aminopeptidase/acylaminoacyl peptidase